MYSVFLHKNDGTVTDQRKLNLDNILQYHATCFLKKGSPDQNKFSYHQHNHAVKNWTEIFAYGTHWMHGMDFCFKFSTPTWSLML